MYYQLDMHKAIPIRSKEVFFPHSEGNPISFKLIRSQFSRSSLIFALKLFCGLMMCRIYVMQLGIE